MPGVLVVDDDEYLREATHTVLEEEGYEVFDACDGVAALAVLRSAAAPLVVLLDNVMPSVTGVDVLTLARSDAQLSRHAYVVWTASPARLPAELLASLSVPILVKPFELDTLVAEVATAAARLDRQADQGRCWMNMA